MKIAKIMNSWSTPRDLNKKKEREKDFSFLLPNANVECYAGGSRVIKVVSSSAAPLWFYLGNDMNDLRTLKERRKCEILRCTEISRNQSCEQAF